MSTAAKRGMKSRRRVLLAAAVGGLVVLSGCATKKDVRTLQATMLEMQAHQDSVLRNIQRQNRLMLDTLRSSMALTLDSRGQTSHRFQELNGLAQSIQQLIGQNLEAMRQMNARLEALESRLLQASQQQASAPPTSTSGVPAAQAYQLGLAKLKEGAYGSARAYFESIIRTYRNDPLAADAQFQIGESWVFEESYDDAYREFEKVASAWPSSPRAGEALYRAGKVAEDQKDTENARKFYNRVVQLYGNTDYAGLARTALRRLPK
jgi:tol-pal system protein YbgF